VGAVAINPALYPNLPYHPQNDLAPVSLVVNNVELLVVHPGSTANDPQQFINLSRQKRITMASSGTGSVPHLAMELLKLELGMDIVHVPFKASGAVITGLLSGQVQATVSALQTVVPQVATGKVRLLGVMSTERANAYPSVPTFRELGFPGLEVDTWYGAFAPAGTPNAVVARIARDLDLELHQPAMRDVLARQGLDPAGGAPERFTTLVRAEITRWKRVVATAGIQPE